MPALEEACGLSFPPADQLHSTETNEFLKGVLKKVGVECSPPLTNARIIDKLVGVYIEETASTYASVRTETYTNAHIKSTPHSLLDILRSCRH